jgi:uncharacterized protein YdbL (DUF1318 family)
MIVVCFRRQSIMRIKSINLAFLLVVLGCFATGTAFAADLSLADAKQQGLVGEQYDGYLGVVAQAQSGTVQSLVTSINTKRRAQYQRIAKTNGISVADVEALAGQKALQKTAAGNYVKAQGGDWSKK